MKKTEDYIREWDANSKHANQMIKQLTDQKYLRKILETTYYFNESVSGTKRQIPLSDPRVQQILNFLQTEISKSDLNRYNFALQLLSLPNFSKNKKISFYFNHGYGFDGSSNVIGFDIQDGFDQNQKLTSIGREALRHEGPMGHGAQIEHASLYKWENGTAHPNPLFNDVQAALISNIIEAKAMTAQCIANFETHEPKGINSVGFSKALAEVLEKNKLTEQDLRSLAKTNPNLYNKLITTIKKKQFAYMTIHRANIGGYQNQTLVFMNFHGKGTRNTPLFKKFFECECRSLGLNQKDTAEVWHLLQPYAIGKSIPGFTDFFNDAGNLRVADRNAIKAKDGVKTLRSKLINATNSMNNIPVKQATSPQISTQKHIQMNLSKKIATSIRSRTKKLWEIFSKFYT